MVLLWILAATFLVSIIAFIGILTLYVREKRLEKVLLFLVSLSAGALMGGAFLHLIPEATEGFGNGDIFIYVLIGFILFFFIEKILHWRHCHKEECPVHTFAYMNLLGDGVHNFIDGLIIAAGFLTNFHLGVVTTLAVALHEIPQEIGDYGVLVFGGVKKVRALFLNFVTALAAVFGGIFGFYLSSYVESSVMFLLPFAAGGFIYIAASDLIPEIRKEAGLKRSMISFGVFIIGILIMYSIRFIGLG
ncbi:MAG: ZIP family metal transporter [Thermoplasmata archaeon]|nr:ZIP family metal transporter [Thermoplasmata archaeon]